MWRPTKQSREQGKDQGEINGGSNEARNLSLSLVTLSTLVPLESRAISKNQWDQRDQRGWQTRERRANNARRVPQMSTTAAIKPSPTEKRHRVSTSRGPSEENKQRKEQQRARSPSITSRGHQNTHKTCQLATHPNQRDKNPSKRRFSRSFPRDVSARRSLVLHSPRARRRRRRRTIKGVRNKTRSR